MSPGLVLGVWGGGSVLFLLIVAWIYTYDRTLGKQTPPFECDVVLLCLMWPVAIAFALAALAFEHVLVPMARAAWYVLVWPGRALARRTLAKRARQHVIDTHVDDLADELLVQERLQQHEAMHAEIEKAKRDSLLRGN